MDTVAAAERVRVTGLEARLIATPIKMKRSQGVGSVQGKVKRVLVRLRTDVGVEGLGEAAPWEVFSGTAEAALAALDIYLRPIVVGADPRRIQAIMAACDRALYENVEAKAAVEMALFDICGKLAGRPVFDLLLRFAISEDGALHAEKYYRTVTEEFATTRPAFRWRQLVGLARVTASEFGKPAPGYAESCELLKV